MTYEEQTYHWMKPLLKTLKTFTMGCRIDMHEPDEQGIYGRVFGTILDNAHGEAITIEALRNGFQEIVVVLENGEGDLLHINLASLIALARLAVVPYK